MVNEDLFRQLFETIEDRKRSSKEQSYTKNLMDEGENKIIKKLGEEFSEILIEIGKDNNERITYEAVDFLYHLVVLLSFKGITIEAIYSEIKDRMK